jgi:hypothetical protein
MAKKSQRRLDSWKEIAVYLRREVRTVQRWERFEGLPVRRLFHRKSSSVYAFASELDRWMERRSPMTENSNAVKSTSTAARSFPSNTRFRPFSRRRPPQGFGRTEGRKPLGRERVGGKHAPKSASTFSKQLDFRAAEGNEHKGRSLSLATFLEPRARSIQVNHEAEL